MTIRLCELRSNLSLKDAANSTEEIIQNNVYYLHKINSEYSDDLLCI